MDELDDIFKDDEPVINGQILDSEDGQSLNPFDDDFLEPSITQEIPDEILIDFLKTKGIEDGKIKIIDENNEEQDVDFFSLTREEQLDIMNASDSDIDYGLENDEIEIINYLRENNLTFQEYLEQYKAQLIEELSKETPSEESYEIDEYDDNELYILDLKLKYELTDDELLSELQKELQNPEIFKKKIDKLRADYKILEEEANKQKQDNFNKQRETQYNEFTQTMQNTAIKNQELYGFDLEDSEKEQVLSSLLNLDADGTSLFYKTLNNPQKLYEAAWFLQYGKIAFDTLKNAYESEIKTLKQKIGPEKPPVVIKGRGGQKSIYDLQ